MSKKDMEEDNLKEEEQEEEEEEKEEENWCDMSHMTYQIKIFAGFTEEEALHSVLK